MLGAVVACSIDFAKLRSCGPTTSAVQSLPTHDQRLTPTSHPVREFLLRRELSDLAGWSALNKLGGLNSLALPQAAVNDAGLKEIAKLTQLKSLSLIGSPITDSGLAELKALKSLESLNLVDTNITEKAVPILSEMKKLDMLTIREKQVGKDGVVALKKALPKCDVNAMP